MEKRNKFAVEFFLALGYDTDDPFMGYYTISTTDIKYTIEKVPFIPNTED